jgi:hypothetical protein
MSRLEVTKDFQSFVDGAMIEEYTEIYDFYQAAVSDSQCTFDVEKANGSDDTLIVRPGFDVALRLNDKQLKFLPSWIEAKLMNGLDAETFWAMEHAKANDKD